MGKPADMKQGPGPVTIFCGGQQARHGDSLHCKFPFMEISIGDNLQDYYTIVFVYLTLLPPLEILMFIFNL